MLRRTFLAGGAAALGLAGRAGAQPPGETWEAMRARMLLDFPFQLTETTGTNVLAKWEDLRREPGVTHVIIGSDDDVFSVGEGYGLAFPHEKRPSVAEILAAANKHNHPGSLRQRAAQQNSELLDFYDSQLTKPLGSLVGQSITILGQHPQTDAEVRADLRRWRDRLAASMAEGKLDMPATGEWPAKPDVIGPTELIDWKTAKPIERAQIARIPTADWTEVPAYLRMGGWNNCPDAEYHVVAFRSWRDRYGAELVRMGGDKVELRVKRRPQTREEALALAEEMHLYCEDNVLQGFGDMAPFAASLMASDWWSFWWD